MLEGLLELKYLSYLLQAALITFMCGFEGAAYEVNVSSVNKRLGILVLLEFNIHLLTVPFFIAFHTRKISLLRTAITLSHV